MKTLTRILPFAATFGAIGFIGLIAVAGFVPAVARAQALDVAVDATFGSGVTSGSGDGEALAVRSPAYADVDVGLIFDRDFTSEWGLGVTIQLEDVTAVALVPQARLVRGRKPWQYYAGLGVPSYITPFTLFGGELAGGVLYGINEMFALVGGAQIDVFVAGDDLPKDGSLVMFNVGFGGRMMF